MAPYLKKDIKTEKAIEQALIDNQYFSKILLNRYFRNNLINSI